MHNINLVKKESLPVKEGDVKTEIWRFCSLASQYYLSVANCFLDLFLVIILQKKKKKKNNFWKISLT